jgi:hypothetical protein
MTLCSASARSDVRLFLDGGACRSGGCFIVGASDEIGDRPAGATQRALGYAHHEFAGAAEDLPMNETRRVARHVSPQLDAIAVLEPHGVRVLLATRQRGENQQTPNPTKVGKHLDGPGLLMDKRKPRQPERVLHHDLARDRWENAALAQGHLLAKPPMGRRPIGEGGIRGYPGPSHLYQGQPP